MKRLSTIMKNVQQFVDAHDSSPLKFKDYTPKEPNPNVSVDSMVLRCLKLTELYPSLNTESKLKETRNGRRRSSIDIWRHIIFFFPEVTLLQVMKSLYNVQDDLYGSYCYDVHRRVFFLKNGSLFTGLSGVTSTDEEDEYGLTFDDWNIPTVDKKPVPELPF